MDPPCFVNGSLTLHSLCRVKTRKKKSFQSRSISNHGKCKFSSKNVTKINVDTREFKPLIVPPAGMPYKLSHLSLVCRDEINLSATNY